MHNTYIRGEAGEGRDVGIGRGHEGEGGGDCESDLHGYVDCEVDEDQFYEDWEVLPGVSQQEDKHEPSPARFADPAKASRPGSSAKTTRRRDAAVLDRRLFFSRHALVSDRFGLMWWWAINNTHRGPKPLLAGCVCDFSLVPHVQCFLVREQKSSFSP